MGRRNTLDPLGTLNTVTPCAACKLLRRRCAEDCPFSPYFSPQEPHNFAAVHKVFGASNVSKMLREVPESLRADAANSLVYEANARLRDPVYGCLGAISALQRQVQSLEAELQAIKAEMLKHRCRDHATTNFIDSTTTDHHRADVVVSTAPMSTSMASVLPPPPSRLSPPPPPPPTPLPMGTVSFSSSSTPTTMYTIASGTSVHNSIHHIDRSVPYFD